MRGSFARLAGLCCLMAGGPLVAWWVLDPRALAARLGLLALALALALAGAGYLFQRLARQIDFLIERCNQLALGQAQRPEDWPSDLPELGRLALAIMVLREALVDYLSLYRRFFESAPDMFLTLSPAGGLVLEANQAFYRTLGLFKSEVLGRPVSSFVTLEEGWDRALSGREQLHKGHMSSPRGKIKIEASLSLERGPKDQPWIVGVILRDVTQQERLHQEILEKSTALEKALEEIKSVEGLKDQFLTTLSHELKTPLVSLKGFLQMLRQGMIKQEDIPDTLEVCWRNLGKLETQINNLLDLARLSHAKEQYEMGPVEMGRLVRNEAENLRPLARERRVSIDLEQVSPEPVVVRGNEEKLVQLVDNLLLNAVKYNKEGGEVRVGLDCRGDQVVLTVTDSGVGIAREQMAKIFNRFYRADITGAGRLEGLGIGLSLVQEIVHLHRGDISVESSPGQGTTFHVVLERQE